MVVVEVLCNDERRRSSIHQVGRTGEERKRRERGKTRQRTSELRCKEHWNNEMTRRPERGELEQEEEGERGELEQEEEGADREEGREARIQQEKMCEESGKRV